MTASVKANTMSDIMEQSFGNANMTSSRNAATNQQPKAEIPPPASEGPPSDPYGTPMQAQNSDELSKQKAFEEYTGKMPNKSAPGGPLDRTNAGYKVGVKRQALITKLVLQNR